jgi:hypothetical protein
MKTACIRTYRGPGRISIARFNRGAPKGFKTYRALAPGPWFHSVTADEYLDRYIHEILEELDAQEVWTELHRLVAPHEPHILCWCDLSTVEFCHRRFFASWVKHTIGHVIEELYV